MHTQNPLIYLCRTAATSWPSRTNRPAVVLGTCVLRALLVLPRPFFRCWLRDQSPDRNSGGWHTLTRTGSVHGPARERKRQRLACGWKGDADLASESSGTIPVICAVGDGVFGTANVASLSTFFMCCHPQGSLTNDIEGAHTADQQHQHLCPDTSQRAILHRCRGSAEHHAEGCARVRSFDGCQCLHTGMTGADVLRQHRHPACTPPAPNAHGSLLTWPQRAVEVCAAQRH